MRGVLVLLLALPLAIGCGTDDDKTEGETEECFSDEDCPSDQVCIITHDHESDDHDHGGDCEESQ